MYPNSALSAWQLAIMAVVPVAALDGNPDDPAVLRRFAEATVADYLVRPPLAPLLGAATAVTSTA